MGLQNQTSSSLGIQVGSAFANRTSQTTDPFYLSKTHLVSRLTNLQGSFSTGSCWRLDATMSLNQTTKRFWPISCARPDVRLGLTLNSISSISCLNHRTRASQLNSDSHGSSSMDRFPIKILPSKIVQ